MEKIILFDGSWEGLMTVVFDVFDYKIEAISVDIVGNYQGGIFSTAHTVLSHPEKASRVRKGLLKKVGKQAYLDLYCSFLSERPAAYLLVLRTIAYYFGADGDASKNYSFDEVLQVRQLARTVMRERHRMKAFVRFKLLKDGLYLALVEPDFNVLPLIAKHFEQRYADQRWLIYDVKRSYGIYYDLQQATEIKFEQAEKPSLGSIKLHLDEAEDKYDELWRRYFKSVNILERKNTKLHIQHVPTRYWKYLNEKLDL